MKDICGVTRRILDIKLKELIVMMIGLDCSLLVCCPLAIICTIYYYMEYCYVKQSIRTIYPQVNSELTHNIDHKVRQISLTPSNNPSFAFDLALADLGDLLPQIFKCQIDLLNTGFIILPTQYMHLHHILLSLRFNIIDLLNCLQRLPKHFLTPLNCTLQCYILCFITMFILIQQIPNLCLQPRIKHYRQPCLLPQFLQIRSNLFSLPISLSPSFCHLCYLLIVIKTRYC